MDYKRICRASSLGMMGKNSFIVELNIINGFRMRLLADHKQTVSVYLEEVQSLAEVNSRVIEK